MLGTMASALDPVMEEGKGRRALRVKYREAWHAAVHGVAKSQTRLSD